MAIRNLRYEGDEILTKKSRPIEVIDDKIKELAEDMFDTMHKWDGLGLAAVQVGILKRIIVIDLYDGETQFCLINPEIVEKSKEMIEIEEGCLSLDGVRKTVRWKEIEVEYSDMLLKKHKNKYRDFTAEIIQHEIDHCNGIVI